MPVAFSEWMALILGNAVNCLGVMNISTDVEVFGASCSICLLPENDAVSPRTCHYSSRLGCFLQEVFLLILSPLLFQNCDLYFNFPFVFSKVNLWWAVHAALLKFFAQNTTWRKQVKNVQPFCVKYAKTRNNNVWLYGLHIFSIKEKTFPLPITWFAVHMHIDLLI